MSSKGYIENMSVTMKFAPVLEEYYKIVEKFEPFKKSVINMDDKYNKKRNMNQLKSAKLRFAIAFTNYEIKKRLLLQQQQVEEQVKKEAMSRDGETENTNTEAEDI